MAVGFNTFLKDLNIVQGVSGIALMFERTLGYDTSLVIFIANIFFLLLGLIFLGVKVTKSCIPESILFPIFIKITEWINIDFGKTETILIIISGAIIYGIGIGLVYKSSFSTGGTGILNHIFSKYLKIPIGKALFLTSVIIMSCGYFLFGFETFIYSLLTMYIASVVTDKIMLGISDSKTFFIFTDKENEIKKLIINEFKTGVTMLDAHGGYTNRPKKIILCVMQTRNYIKLKEEILKIDKEADFVITDSYEVIGGLHKYEEVV